MSERQRIPGLVSTIIPVYNRAELLQQAVNSVLQQTYRPIEILIVDDGSTDGTVQAAHAIARANPTEVFVLQRENGGPGLARETGRLHARGEFIQYLDSDDFLLPEKFALQVAALREKPECGVCYGPTIYRQADGTAQNVPSRDSGTRRDAIFPDFLVYRRWETVTPIYRASVCDMVGPWTDLRLEEDWEYDCRFGALQTPLAFVSREVAEHRDHGQARLSRGQALDPGRLAMRARAHALIHAHAVRGGVRAEQDEMMHFSRALFLLARQCGAAGLPAQSSELFALAQQAAGTPRMQMSLYALLARILGWTSIGKLSCMADRLRLQ